MTKTICDICGKDMRVETYYPSTIQELKFCISSYGKIWDICQECRKSFNRWMDIRKQGCDEKGCSYIAESEENSNDK